MISFLNEAEQNWHRERLCGFMIPHDDYGYKLAQFNGCSRHQKVDLVIIRVNRPGAPFTDID